MFSHCHKIVATVATKATTTRLMAAYAGCTCSQGFPRLVPWQNCSAICSAVFSSVIGRLQPGLLSSASLRLQGYHSEAQLKFLNGWRRDSAMLLNSCRSSSLNCQPHTSSYSSGKVKDTIPDLQRFLSEIGTDPKEARFWLKHFLNIDKEKPFAVVEVDSQVFEQPNQLEQLASAVSFLQRNSLQPVLLLGENFSSRITHHSQLQGIRAACTANCCALSDALSEQGLETCVLFAGSGVIHAESCRSSTCMTHVNAKPELIRWCLARQTVPIIPACGETCDGRLVDLDLWDVTSAVTRQLQPLKVIRVNCHGGFQNEHKQVIANINLPFDLPSVMAKSWCTETVAKTIDQVNNLLHDVPERTSVVITAADKVLQELFTHHGSGTFLKLTEWIIKYNSLRNVDTARLAVLLSQAFKKPLCETYFDEIQNHIHTVYVSERYTAAAVVLHVPGCAVPYLCKFVVSVQAQGEGTGDILWDVIRQDFKCLVWRSRGNNPVNPWYFQRSEGSWTHGCWIVFWYGVPDPASLSKNLIHKAIAVPESFGRSEPFTQTPSMA